MSKHSEGILMSRIPMKRSRQRDQILKSLCATKSHPTAQELHRMVRRQMPRVSLGTVYRNLEQMADAGLVLRLDGGPSRRYDGTVSAHGHVRCEHCGVVADLDIPMPSALENVPLPPAAAGYRLSGYSVEFLGACPDCQDRP